MTDLWSGGLNFVFGIGSLRGGVGVYSLCRYFPAFFNEPRRPDDASVSLLRACKVLSHETGHLFGITHCVFYRCGMNGVNSRPEMDSAPLDFCPVCERKLRWNIGYDPVRRTAELARLQGRTTPAG
jgi:archaemetzincin